LWGGLWRVAAISPTAGVKTQPDRDTVSARLKPGPYYRTHFFELFCRLEGRAVLRILSETFAGSAL
jgi:hypothetical protein